MSRDPFFDVNAAFRLVDLSGRGMITKDDIRMLMECRGFFISDQEARSVAKKFDFNGDGVITQNEFVDEVLPKSPARRI